MNLLPVQQQPAIQSNPRASRDEVLLPLLLVCAALYLFLNLFSSPSTPYLLGGDQMFFWLGGQRMLDGERLYTDFLRYTPPGTDVAFFLLFKLFGPRVWVTNLAVFALGLAFTWQCYGIAAKLMPRRAAALAAALFLVVLYGKSLNATNHWFSALAIAFALNTALAGVTFTRVIAAGALLGLATYFNQAHGAAALSAFLITFLLERRTVKIFTILLAAWGITFLLLSLPFLLQSGLARLWYFQVVYVARYSSRLSQGFLFGLPGALSLRTLLSFAQYLIIYLLLPILYLGSLVLCWRHSKRSSTPSYPFDLILLLTLSGTMLAVEVAVNVNWLRLYAVAFPGIVLLVWVLHQRALLTRRASAVLWLAIILLAAHQTRANRAMRPIHATFPGGRLATSPEVYNKLASIARRTQPGDRFFQAGWPGLYLPLRLRHPLFLSTVTYLDATRPVDIPDTVRQLEITPVPFILWTPNLDAHCPLSAPCRDYLVPLRDYLSREYSRVQTFPDGDTLWQKHP